MDVSSPSSVPSFGYPAQQNPVSSVNIYDSEVNVDYLIINSLPPAPGRSESDRISIGFDGQGKNLAVAARKIIDRLNELLKDTLPEGIESLKPEDYTPQATADRIVKATTAFFDIYAEQHPELEGEELLQSFLTTIRGGIEKGYGEAYGMLESMGAFQFDGVRESVEQTKLLIDAKLKSYEAFKREQLGLGSSLEQNSNELTKNNLLQEGGVGLG